MERHTGYLHWLACLVLLLGSLMLGSCSQTQDPELTPTASSSQPANEAQPSPGNLDAALQFWQQTLEEAPDNVEAHYNLALILILDDPNAAASHLDQIDSAPEYADQVSRLQTALRQSLVIEDQAYYLTIIGQALASIEEWPLAQIALERAVSEDPDYAEAWAYLGEAIQQNGDESKPSEAALEALQKAHALKPDSFAANLFLSLYYRRSGKALAAVEYLETAILSDPENKDLQADLAQTHVEAGGANKGFQILETLADESPDEAESWLRLARLSINNNLQVNQTGLSAARQALLLAPDQPEGALLLGRAYLLLGEKVLAERFLNKALQIDPEAGEAHYYLGILYLNAGQGSEAKNHLNAVISLAMENGNHFLANQATTILNEYFGE